MWSDSETKHDFLGYRSYVSTLADICLHPELAPLTLGIFGAWGSGKTSLMQMLKAHIDGVSNAKDTQTLWFNAWRYGDRDEAHSALLHTILHCLEKREGFIENAKDVLGRLKQGASVLKLAKFITTTAITLTPDIKAFLDCFKEQSANVAKTMHDFENDFRELLKKGNVRRLVVFIDDLDRCQSAKVIEVFETIKLFLNIPATTFVLGADAKTITDAVGIVYRVEDERRRRDYLEKIVQIPFNIPEQKLADLSCFVGMLILDGHLNPDHRDKLVADRGKLYTATGTCTDSFCTWAESNSVLFTANEVDKVNKELRHVLPHMEILARGLKGNPRQIKRFLNILSLRQRLAAANDIDVAAAFMMKLGIIEYVWEDIFKAIAQTMDPATGHSLLLAELEKESEQEAANPSQMLQQAQADVAFVQFIRGEPALTGSLDLRNYLYLAQTALGPGKVETLLPADEEAKQLAADIESPDRIRSQAGAMRAAATEAAVAAAVVRRLSNDLASSQETKTKVGIIQGLMAVCQRHAALFAAAVDTARRLEPGKDESVALAAATLLAAAQKAGVSVEPELIERFQGVSSLVRAMGTKGRGTAKRGT